MNLKHISIVIVIFLSSCKPTKVNTSEKVDINPECLNIFESVLNRNISDVKKLVNKDNSLTKLKDSTNHLFTPLFYATKINSTEKFDYLLSNGADVKAMTSKNIYPQYDVLYVALKFDSDDVLKKIIELKAFDLNKKYNDCENAINKAVRNNSTKCLKILLDQKVNFNVTDDCSESEGISPLGWAALENSVGAAKLLIEYGANVNEQKKENSHSILGTSCSSINGSIEMLDLLIENGADLELSNHLNFTPLMNAVARGKTEIVKYLLSKGANPNAQTNNSGWTPLHYACSRNNMILVEMLLKGGAHPNVLDKENLKPIDKLQTEEDKQKMLDLME